jgi:hypothetical protein
MKKTTIGNTGDHQLTTLVNSSSTALLISLPPKGANWVLDQLGFSGFQSLSRLFCGRF